MPRREVGGRILPFEPGSTQYEDDEFRGQRRRPWMCFRIGALTQEFTTENFICFIDKVKSTLLEKGILLDSDPLKYTFVDIDYSLLNTELKGGLEECKRKYEPGPLSHPIVILILDQYDINQVDEIIETYVNNTNFFKLDVPEALEMIQSYEYEKLDEICEEFANYLKASEDVVESIAIRWPVEERIPTFGSAFDAPLAMPPAPRQHRDQRYNQRNYTGQMDRYNTYSKAPPGLPPPGLRKTNGKEIDDPNFLEPPGLAPPRSPALSSIDDISDNQSILGPPGLLPPRDPGLDVPPNIQLITRAYPEYSQPGSEAIRPGISGVEMEEIEGDHLIPLRSIHAARTQVEDSDDERGIPFKQNYSLMANHIIGDRLYERFKQPFRKLTSNLDLLYVINYAVSTKQKDAHSASKTILAHAFANGLTLKLKKAFLDRPFSHGNWTEDAAEMLFELIMMHFYAARFKGGFMLTIDSYLLSWNEIVESWNITPKDRLHEVHVTSSEIENLKKVVGQVKKWIYQAEQSLNEPISYPPEDDRRGVPSRNQEGNHYPRLSEQRATETYGQQRDTYHNDRRTREGRQDEYTRASGNYPREERIRDHGHNQQETYYETGRDEVDLAADRRRYAEENQVEYSRDNSLGFHGENGHIVCKDAEVSFPGSDKTIIERTSHNETLKDKQTDEETFSPDQPVVNSDEREKQKYKYNENDYHPPWMKCELIDPPDDFKILTSVPILADYVNPVEPYLRRIREDGVYKSATHYLDVQFRLMREDLVSPLRDGLDMYRKNGTCRGNRIEGVPCSDVSIFNIERVDGKQVTERDGLEMRVAWPSQFDISRLLENDREMKELGLMMLSNDRFTDDFHLTYVQSSLLNVKGCLHLVILEETAPFKPNTSYQMAQGTSYLPSYKHVLENLRRTNPFKPLPFERYIVHGKKEIFRPAFQRAEKNEAQLAEEKRLETIYGEIRSIAVANRYMKGKSVPGGTDVGGDDDDYYYNSANRSSSMQKEDDFEYEQLKEPIFRPQLGVPTRGSDDQILIGKKWYRISRMLDDFHPTYLDESQRLAYIHTMRSEFSIIQGPPGTGKTHIGVEIVKTMLQNRSHWRMTEPILIVCYTNSGLDNLLERVWQMIEDDEELSKDNGKPRMIRYGRKCDSEFLKRRGVMRQQVNDQYKGNVSDRLQSELSKAGANKRRKNEALSVSSYTLYCSRNELLSYDILSRVMDPNYQKEIAIFAMEHVDTKECLLNSDEALACWLLDRDFGKASKAQMKRTNKKQNKFTDVPDDSDDEKSAFLTVENSDEEDESNMDDEKILDKLFNKMNLECSGKDVLNAVAGGEEDEYLTNSRWEIVQENQPQVVILMGRKEKNGLPVDEQIASLVKDLKGMIMAAPPLRKEELSDIKFIFSLARPKRWALYNTWCSAVRKLVIENLPKQIQEYRTACQAMQKAYEVFDAEVMKMPMVVAATTSGCSRLRPMLEMVKPRILIVEEAAEVLESHILSAMVSSVEQVVMIGDHKQLRPNPAVHELGLEYGMNISMFERLVERGLPYRQLREQHRMNTTITDLIVKPSFYPNVHDAESVMGYPDVEGMDKNLFFWTHSGKEETPDGISWLNKSEVNMVAALVQHLLKQDYTYKDIVVLATYAAQRNYMYREYGSIFGSPDTALVPVETVDSYQGRESKLTIVSLVRSHRGVQENLGIGFLAVANRICVALTRAQHGMYIIGNGGYLQNNSTLWRNIVRNLDNHNLIAYALRLKCTAHGNMIRINEPDDFKTCSPEGGCLDECGIQKECGHVCRRLCHPRIEAEHRHPCEYPCSKSCKNEDFRHACPKKCHEECGNCTIFVEVKLDCNHLITTPCSRISIARCDQKCNNFLDCGHKCPNNCGAPCVEVCQEKVTIRLSCNHTKVVPCWERMQDKFDKQCVERCEERMLICAHQCAELCGAQCTVECKEIISVLLKCNHWQDVICSNVGANKDTSHIECKTFVPLPLKPCNHTGHVQCGQDPSTEFCVERCREELNECKHNCGNECGICYKTGKHVCQQRCEKFLDCGHECSAKCGEKCPPCRSFCSNMCEHQSCGIGEKGFGRECSNICSLCVSNCSNKCMHRSCTKYCYEECDVKTCTEPCSEKLRCGHACLGMCGEMCPKICGTCEREKYVACVSNMDKSSQKVHRLVMNPKCHHIFPVEALDELVKAQKDAGKQLRCPKCNAVITGVQRYAKYTKKRIIDINVRKLRKIACTEKETTDIMIVRIREDVSEIIRKIENVIGTQNKRSESFTVLQTFKTNVQDVTKRLLTSPKTTTITSGSYNTTQISRIASIPPNVDMMIGQMFPESILSRMVTELKELNKFMKNHISSVLPGVVMPTVRLQLARMTVLYELAVMCSALKSISAGMSEDHAKAIGKSCKQFYFGDERQSLDVHMEEFEKLLLNVVPKIGTMSSFSTWKKLNLPKF
ncbi:unnamed protein product [Caenorhabditis sp. 36 PRJEB53466]|nr:unnamed protein product [Caenorhabditis sp. 36 PRJEB53466]